MLKAQRINPRTLEGVKRNAGYVRFGSKADMCSALAHVRFVPIATLRSFEQFVGAGEYGRRNCEAQCFRGLEVDHELVFGWRLCRAASLMIKSR